MKLEYGSETLGDDATGDFITDHGGDNLRQIQTTPLVGGTTIFLAARGNHANQRSFTVVKQHATLAKAVEWWNTHPDALADSGLVRLTQNSYAAQMDALLVSVARVELLGVSTTLTYTFIGKQITAAA